MEWIHATYQSLIGFFNEVALFLTGVWSAIQGILENPTIILNQLWPFFDELYYLLADKFILTISTILSFIIGLLPDINFGNEPLPQLPSAMLNSLNWFFPISTLVNAFEWLIMSTIFWVSTGVLFRWFKVNS